MSHPTPLQSLLGGLTIPISTHSLMLLNGNVFGISGFIHRAVKGSVEATAGVAGLVFGGMLVAAIDKSAPPPLPSSFQQLALAGFLVGLGTKLSNGCTSGHMLCGLSRLSLRSLVATATFCATGAITANLVHGDYPPVGSYDWTLGAHGKQYLLAQALPFAATLLLTFLRRKVDVKQLEETPTEETRLTEAPKSDSQQQSSNQPLLRILGFFTTSVHFALALQLSNLTDPVRVIGFLLLPIHKAFDPSLVFLAAGAMPLGMLLYRYARGNEKPIFGGPWSIPKQGAVDLRLVGGAAIFGVGWGIAGICPGPGLVNLGRALIGGANASQFATWLAALTAGGLLV